MPGESDHLKTEQEIRQEICTVGRWMYERAFVVASEGNLSVRLGADRILVTPSGACKGRMTPEDLLVTDLNGEVVCSAGRPSSEMEMHLLYYHSRPDVQAVCHAHPPTATAFAASGRPLEEAVLPEVVICLGKIPLAPYGTPGTPELCARLKPLVSFHDAILLENHGVVTCGQNLATAFSRLEMVEHFARVLLAAESLGGPRLLPRAEVQKLIAARARYGVSCPADSAAVPLAAESKDDMVTLTRHELECFLEETLAWDRARRPSNQIRSA